MVDRVDKRVRSRMMAGIRSSNTKPEILVRQTIHRAGFRFRLHSQALPGRPDIVLPRLKVAIFVHGCFWHRHPGCHRAYLPSSRVEYWLPKFERNIARDAAAQEQLSQMGWTPLVIWECETAPQELANLVQFLRERRAAPAPPLRRS
jgi:DNA mismatch endonuclease (patch repair protein)